MSAATITVRLSPASAKSCGSGGATYEEVGAEVFADVVVVVVVVVVDVPASELVSDEPPEEDSVSEPVPGEGEPVANDVPDTLARCRELPLLVAASAGTYVKSCVVSEESTRIPISSPVLFRLN